MLEGIEEEDDEKVDLEELRKRRLRTEKHVAIIVKENPEMLDMKSKEIIARIDPKHLKRNNQLVSLDTSGQ